jgi:transcriptional regulator with XRE-family HTH domain
MTDTSTPRKAPAFTIADRMRKARQDKGYERADLARMMGVEANTVSRWENHWGENPPPHRRLVEWADICEVPLAWLLTGEGSTSTIWYGRFTWSTAYVLRVAQIAYIGAVR